MTQSQQVIEELYEAYTKTAANIITYYGSDERKAKLKELRDIVQNNCIQDKKLKSAEQIRSKVLSSYNDGDDDNAQTDVQSLMQEYEIALSEIDTDVSNDKKIIEFDRHVTALLDRGADQENDAEDDMQLTGGYINVIDPITKKRIVDPVKNAVCGHTYDRDSITQLLKHNKKTRCPVSGCRSKEYVLLSKLTMDIVTKTYLEKNPQ